MESSFCSRSIHTKEVTRTDAGIRRRACQSCILQMSVQYAHPTLLEGQRSSSCLGAFAALFDFDDEATPTSFVCSHRL